jgi:glycosyltransferase 2 family protein
MTSGSVVEIEVVDADPLPPLVRSTVYVFRALVGLVLIVLGVGLLAIFDRALLGLTDDIATIQAGWPSWLGEAIDVTIGLTAAMAILGTNAYLVFKRRFRRFAMINVAGISALILTAVVQAVVLNYATSEQVRQAVDVSGSDGFGNNFLGSLVAVVTVASVWIGPRLRPWVVGYVGAAVMISFLPGSVAIMALPIDVGVGILTGSLVALILRTRDRTPTPHELSRALAESGIPIASLERASVDARGSVPWFATTTMGGRLFVKTLNSDQRAADLLFRIYRLIRLRRAGDRAPFSSLRRSVEHEALLSLSSDARGIRTPRLVTVSEVGADGMLLAYQRIEGRSLDAVDPERITDAMLDDVWTLVSTMQTAAIAHRDLRLANLFVGDDDTPWIIDFGFAELAADEDLLARDRAELLASTSVAVGADRSVAAAARIMGAESIATALAWVQPLALSSATRTQIGKSEKYAELRKAASAVVGVEEVKYERLERVKPGTLLIFASVAVALYVLIPQFAQAAGFWDEVKHANLGWVAITIVASAMTYVGAALGMIGAVPMRLPFLPMFEAQIAGSFSNRVTPAKVGGMATNVRFLQKQDIPLSVAASAVGLNTVAGTLIHISLLVLFGAIASRAVDVPLPSPQTAAIVAVVLVLASGLLMLLPAGRKLLTTYLVPALKAGASAIATIARSPVKLIALFTGSALVTLSYTMAMLASLAAFGTDVPIVTAAFVYLAGAAVSSAAPTPGGIGATEAALVAGYTAVGVEASTAFAAVLLFRLVTFWLPILPGWLALVRLQRANRL